MALTNAQVQINLTASESFTTGSGTDTHPGNYYSALPALSAGTGANKAQKVANYTATLTTGTTTIDLTAIAGGIGGAAINFSLIKQIIVANADPTNNIAVTNGTNPATNTINPMTIGPNGVYCRVEQGIGMTVDSTHKTITLAASASTVVVNIVVVGEGT